MVPTVHIVLLVGTVRSRPPCTVVLVCFRTLNWTDGSYSELPFSEEFLAASHGFHWLLCILLEAKMQQEHIKQTCWYISNYNLHELI
jgi:hypothetical protein